MIHVVIVGGGELGRHIASLLSKEKHNVILIDKNPKVLQEIAGSLDIATRLGNGNDWQLLDDLLEFSPELFLALTGNDELNVVSCAIAKQLKYPRTIARIRNSLYTQRVRLDFGRLFDVDYFIGPELLVAQEILKHIESPGSFAVENFAHGALQLRTLLIPTSWEGPSKSLRSFWLPPNIIIGLIKRENKEIGPSGRPTYKIIFPHGEDFILPGDEVTFIGETEAIENIHHFFAIEERKVKSMVIAGGSLTGLYLAELASHREIDVRIIDKSYEKCCILADRLPKCTIIQHDATDLDFLRSEKIGLVDLFVSCTNSDAVNLLTSLLSKEAGCPEIMTILNEPQYTSLAEHLGLHQIISPRTIAGNHIISQIFSGKVTSLVSLYENQAEVLEIIISMNSKVVGIPLAELGPFLPTDFLIVMIQNRGRIMIAHGNRIISPGDTVIVVTSPQHVDELSKIF